MKKVLFIIWSLERGGAERFLAGLLHHLDRTKFQPTLCCLNWKGQWGEDVERAGIPVIALNKKGKVDLKAFRQLKRIFREGQFDIVNTHLWLADTMGRLAAIQTGVKTIVSTAQNVDIWKKGWHKQVDRWFGRRTQAVIAVSKAVKKYYHEDVGLPEDKIHVIPNAIDPETYNHVESVEHLYEEFNLDKDNFVLACIGRLNMQKGHQYLIQAVARLKDSHPRLRILIVGKGETQAEMEQLSHTLNITDRLRFVGHRSDIAAILQFSHGLILPSIFEGLPLCVLEAMAASRPVIATDVGGTAELAIDQETAFIVPPRDVDQLAQAIAKLMDLPDHGQGMGQRGRKVVESNFSIQAITRQTEELFTTLVENHQ